MGKIIAVSNQKGGVGKSTTVVNLAAALGGKGKKVLVVDIDAQGNTTTGFGVRKKAIVNTVYEVLIGACRAADAIVPTAYKGVSLISSAQKLAGAEIELASVENRLMRLKMQLLTVKDMFDFILIDSPPSLSLITLNALACCDSVLIPIQCEFYSLVYDVCRKVQSHHSGCERGQKILPGRRVQDGDTEKRGAFGGAQPRKADNVLRSHV